MDGVQDFRFWFCDEFRFTKNPNGVHLVVKWMSAHMYVFMLFYGCNLFYCIGVYIKILKNERVI
jgi:hypothetical protein